MILGLLNPGGNTPQNSSYMATNHPSQKLSKLDKPDMRDTAGKVGMNLMSDTLLWTSSHRWAKVRRPARTNIQQLCADTGCSLEDLQGAMDNRDRWRERVRGSMLAAHDDDNDIISNKIKPKYKI